MSIPEFEWWAHFFTGSKTATQAYAQREVATLCDSSLANHEERSRLRRHQPLEPLGRGGLPQAAAASPEEANRATQGAFENLGVCCSRSKYSHSK